MTAKAAKPNAQATAETAPYGPVFAPMTDALSGWRSQNARFALAGVEAMAHALTSWRHLIDLSTTAIRRQQDLALDLIRTQWSNAAEPATDEASAPAFFAPIYAAAKAYEKVSEGVLQAQRSALEAMSHVEH